MLYALIATDKPDSLDRRLATRPVHLDHLASLGTRLKLAGALLGPDDQPQGSLMVIEAASLAEATAAFEADPFVKQGIFASYDIKPWRVAIDNYRS